MLLTCWVSLLGCGREIADPAGRTVIPQPTTQKATGQATDLELTGPGFFVLALEGQLRFTRLGQFTVDPAGYLVNLWGWRVQVYPADPGGTVSDVLGDLPVGLATISPSPTANVIVRGNLAADAPTRSAFDTNDPTSTSNFKTSLSIYDSLGAEHTVQLYFARTAAGSWGFHVLTDGSGLRGGTAGVASEIASGTLSYEASGALHTVSYGSSFYPLGGGLSPQALRFDFGDQVDSGGTGYDGLTQFGGTDGVSIATFTGQDGNGVGSIAGIQVNNRGEVLGAFSNGMTRLLGIVAFANFSRVAELLPGCDYAYAATPLSGPPAYRLPANGLTSVISGALEFPDAPWCP